jgi:hypothetical protein
MFGDAYLVSLSKTILVFEDRASISMNISQLKEVASTHSDETQPSIR